MRRAWLAVMLLLAAVGAGFVSCSREASEQSDGVALVLSTEAFSAVTTFELRFEDPVVTAAELDRPVEPSPLVIEPPLPGRFVWAGVRTGTYVPTAAPKLGTTYRFRLRDGLKGPGGTPVTARLRRTLATPALEFIVTARSHSPSNAPASPEIGLNFNADVLAGAVQAHAVFRDASGREVRTRVTQATEEDEFHTEDWSTSRDLATWARQFALNREETVPRALSGSGSASGRGDEDGAEPDAAGTGRPSRAVVRVPNRVFVSPVVPLPPGAGWRLVLAGGLPSADRSVRLGTERLIPWGAVVPLAVTGVDLKQGLQSGRRMVVRFTKGVRVAPSSGGRSGAGAGVANEPAATDVDPGVVVTVTPAPTNLVIAAVWSGVELRGAFELETDYTVTVPAGGSGADGSVLERGWSSVVRFSPLPPRLYFPALAGDQLAMGGRRFEVLAVNPGPIRVRARKLDRHTLIHALRGYRGYEKSEAGVHDPLEPYQAVDFSAVPGPLIYDRVMELEAEPDESERLSLSWDSILGTNRPGAVFLVAEQELPGAASGGKGGGESEPRPRRQGAQALMQITDLGLAWKEAGSELVVHVFSHRTGAGAGGATISVLTDDQEVTATGVAGADGTATLGRATNAVWLMAEMGEDLHAVRLDGSRLWAYSYGLPYEGRRTSGTDPSVFLFTDRPVYRPGETGHLKLIVRRPAPDGWTVPVAGKVPPALRLFNGRGEVYLQTNLVLSALGSASFDFPVPEGGRGRYRAMVTFEGREHDVDFHVADFQADAFAVRLGSPAVVPAGGTFRAPVSAAYFSGAPLSRAKVVWSASLEDARFQPEGLEAFQFLTSVYDSRLGRNGSAHEIHGQIDALGRSNGVVELPLTFNPAAPAPRQVTLRAEVTDLTQQTLSRTSETLCHSSEFYLGVRQFSDVVRAGDPIPVEVTAVRPDGRPLDTPVALTLRLDRLNRHTVRVEGAGRHQTYRSELLVSNLLSVAARTVALRRQGVEWVTAPFPGPGEGASALGPLEPGQYLLEARAKDSGGRDVVTAFTFYVYGRSEVSWDYANAHQLGLVPDRASYSAGETARILVKAPFSGTAWVTVERERVRRSYSVALEAGAPGISVPLEDADAPNVYVSVLLCRGSADSRRDHPMPEYRLGLCELKVANPRSRLHLAVTTGAAEYRPGGLVRVEAEVTDDGGRAVPGAEVTLYAVDEGVLSLTGQGVPDPHEVFSRLRGLEVSSSLSLPLLLPEDPARLGYGNKGYIIGGGGNDAESVRRDFLPCAYWNAGLVTDASGRVSAEFRAPDSLTRYRVVAVAHDARSRFGSDFSGFRVNKPWMIEPSLPRFAHVGDRLQARAVVQNLTASPGEAEVSLRLDPTAFAPGAAPGELRRMVTIPARGSAVVDFPVGLREPGTAKWIWSARGRALADSEAAGGATGSNSVSRYTDVVESTLVVEHALPLIREMRFGVVTSGQTNLLAGLDPRLLEGPGTLTVSVANSRLAELGAAPEELLQYPYGCVEQTGSSLLPWLVLRRAPSVAPSLERRLAESGRAVAKGVQRLLSMQTQSGGLSYWPGSSEPMPWGSAYGAMILELARREGHEVPASRLEALRKYLSAGLRERDDDGGPDDLEAHCLSLYALALGGRAEPAYHERLLRDRARLGPAPRALLALAMLESGASARDVAALMAGRAATSRADRHWFGSDARDGAMALLVELRIDPRSDRAARGLAELIEGRRQGHWSTTQGNAWALLALAEYAVRLEPELASALVTLSAGGQPEALPLPGQPGSVRRQFAFGAGTTNASLGPIVLGNPQARRLFTQVTVESRTSSAHALQRGDGFSVQRTYAKLDDDGAERPVDDLRVGDRVLVTLFVTVRDPAHFVAVDDPLPAVLEPVVAAFKSRETIGAAGLGPASLATLAWPTSHREVRVDRVLFFGDHVETPGRYELRYVARVRAAGTAVAPPTKVEAMYRPEQFGLGQLTTLTARPLATE